MPSGIHSEYYEVAKEYEDIIQYDQPIHYSSLTPQKKGRIVCLNYTSTDLTSPFFTYGIASLSVMYATFSGFLYFSESGMYSFRFTFESEQDKVSDLGRVICRNVTFLGYS